MLISAAISANGAPRELLVAWYTGRFEMIVSYDVLYELEAVLMRPWFRRKLAYADVIEYVMWIRERATFVPDAPPLEGLEGWYLEPRPDPDDVYLVALAKEHRADYLVTGDRDLRAVAPQVASRVLSFESLVVLDPRDFVRRVLRPAP